MSEWAVWTVVSLVALVALFYLATSPRSAVGGSVRRDRRGNLIFMLSTLKRKRRRW